jgi:membrane-associated phospholipid phosphatase
VNIAPDDAALRWRTYGRWAGLNLLVFGVLYPLVNWLTGARASTFGLYLDGERTIPFLPAWIWAYLSINLLFMLPPLFMRASDMPLLGKRMLVATLSGCLIFLLLPARLGFERVVPGDGLYRAVFGGLFQADGPHNLVPSLHVTYASLCILSFQAAAREWRTRAAWGLWLVTIMASTVLVHQHHLLDVVSGLGLAAVIRVWIPERKQSGER